jgi:hypothetical protein
MSTINEGQVKTGMEMEPKQSCTLGAKYCVYAKRRISVSNSLRRTLVIVMDL